MVSSALQTKLSDSYSLLRRLQYGEQEPGIRRIMHEHSADLAANEVHENELYDCRNTVTWILLLVAGSE